MGSVAPLCELVCYPGAVGQEPGRLHGRAPSSEAWAWCPQPEHALVTSRLQYFMFLRQVLHSLQAPGGGTSWVFMQEQPALSQLFPVHRHHELYVVHGLEPSLGFGVAPGGQIPQAAEHCADGAAYH